MAKPIRVGNVYQIGANRFEVTAFNLMTIPPEAIGVESNGTGAWERHYSLAELSSARLMSGGMGQEALP